MDRHAIPEGWELQVQEAGEGAPAARVVLTRSREPRIRLEVDAPGMHALEPDTQDHRALEALFDALRDVERAACTMSDATLAGEKA